ncbi:conserved hypothetical protein [Caldicellulosiruptor hydrothermalis 108]|uniref:Uncharacterized protein n=1 Tax=Caldicellulosiruptor hydrothermalis (strain DSM 18901 / VKM B-2411 / 108) TaxID=632292 RepID=E4Q796_CALH1|nr:hypothetical protein [Caldicellulosiruptor hydrothermalis]ADQ06609.1 conserved hypothetical protein [Caldicellulosiruptor hydrothermalis 108]
MRFLSKKLWLCIVVMLLFELSGCKNTVQRPALKIFPDYIAKGYVEISSKDGVSKYSFLEKRIDGRVEAEFVKGTRKIKLTKEDGNVLLDGKNIKSISQDIFLDYYIDKLINAEKYSIVVQQNQTIVTLELKGDIRYLHFYFVNGELEKIGVIYQDKRFMKTIYLTEYKKYRKG